MSHQSLLNKELAKNKNGKEDMASLKDCTDVEHIGDRKKKVPLEVLGIEPRASCMQSMHSTTELHPQVKAASSVIY